MEAACIAVEQKIDDLKKQILVQQGRKEQIRRCLEELRHCDTLLEDFNLDLWSSMIECVTVAVDGQMTFRFRDGTEIPVDIHKKQVIDIVP